MLEIGSVIRHTATWHKLLKSTGASFMSLFDVMTDVYTIMYYFEKDMDATGFLMMSFVSVSLVLQVSGR